MKKIIITFAILIVIGIGVYFVFFNPVYYKIPSGVPSDVSMKNFLFNPSTVTVKPGVKVTWINNDVVAHTVTSDMGGLLDSPALSPGQSFSFTFTDTGSVNYHCAIHPTMKGAVVVGK